jgi:hypothetical protein
MKPRRTPATERFWAKVNKQGPTPEHRPELGPCWVWTASKTSAGYGQFHSDTGRNVLPHRWAYLEAHKTVPDGKVLDHLCRNRACVNPAHLEPVTQSQNVLRGNTRATLTKCRHGHTLTPDNVYHPPKRPADRHCRICKRRIEAERKRRKRLSAPRIV